MLYGLTWTAYAIGSATGPLVIGHRYDRTGAYEPRFIVGLAIVALMAAVISVLLRTGSYGSPADSNKVFPGAISLDE